MTAYSVVLYLHVLATLVLFGVLSVEVLILHHLRRAASIAEARPGMNPAPGLRIAAIGSLLFLFLSGGYLAGRISAWNSAWPRLTVAAIVFFAGLGAVSGRRLGAIRAMATDRELASRLHDPILPGSLGIRIGLGVILLMTTQPGMLESFAILGTGMLLGLGAIRLLLGTPAASPVASVGRPN